MCFIGCFHVWTDVCGTGWLHLGQALAAECAEIHPSAARANGFRAGKLPNFRMFCPQGVGQQHARAS